MLWNRNESDILEEIVTDACKNVDSLFIADGHSTDGSWEILQSLKGRLPKIEHLQQGDETYDRAQRNSLLDAIRKRYKAEDTWVQIIESDVFICDTKIPRATRSHGVDDIAVPWLMLNAVRKPGTWAEVDTYPHWKEPIRTLMPYAHQMEIVTYTFRPLPGLEFDQNSWRPWPSGFSRYTSKSLQGKPRGSLAPLLLHVGYRGPKHFHEKYKHMGKRHTKHRTWWVNSPANVERTVPYFNGAWNGNDDVFEANRGSWHAWRKRVAATK